MPEITPATSQRRIGRSILAVIAGIVAIVALSIATDAVLRAAGIFPPLGQPMSDSLYALATVYRFLYGIAGGYLAARLAPHAPVGHALVLGAVGLVLSMVGVVAAWNRGPEFGPKWYPIALVITALPSAWLGGRLRRGQA